MRAMLIRKSVSLKSYGTFHPSLPYLRLSWTTAWKRARTHTSGLNACMHSNHFSVSCTGSSVLLQQPGAIERSSLSLRSWLKLSGQPFCLCWVLCLHNSEHLESWKVSTHRAGAAFCSGRNGNLAGPCKDRLCACMLRVTAYLVRTGDQ